MSIEEYSQANRHAAAAPPRSVTNSRRLNRSNCIRSPQPGPDYRIQNIELRRISQGTNCPPRPMFASNSVKRSRPSTRKFSRKEKATSGLTWSPPRDHHSTWESTQVRFSGAISGTIRAVSAKPTRQKTHTALSSADRDNEETDSAWVMTDIGSLPRNYSDVQAEPYHNHWLCTMPSSPLKKKPGGAEP